MRSIVERTSNRVAGILSLIKLEAPGDDGATHIATASPPER
jgi:hypothetical protein